VPRLPIRRADLVSAALCLTGAFWVTCGAWVDPNHRAIRVNASDQALFEWLLSYAANAVTHLHNPLWTNLINVPDGVNLAVNTTVTVLGVLLAPVTLTLGAPVAFLVALTANLAATGYAWYWLLSRRLGVGRVAAAVGGLFCGFAPGVISHANAHLNFTALWLVPLIIDRVAALRRPGSTDQASSTGRTSSTGRSLRDGALLGLLIVVQYSLGAEVLFFTALACGVFGLCWVLAGHREPAAHVQAFGRGLVVSAAVAAALLAYPLWLQFAGPQTYHGTGFSQRIHSEDLQAYTSFPSRSLAGVVGLSGKLAPNPTEENSFFGWPLLLMLAVAVVLLLRHSTAARRALVWALTGTGVLFAICSFGPKVKYHGDLRNAPLPYAALARLPLFDSALPARLALVVVPLIGVLLALVIEAAGRPSLAPHRRWLITAALVAALLPIVPVPLLTMQRSPVPHFITAGTWRQYVRPGETLVPVPPPSDLTPDGQRWQAAALSTGDGTTFRIPAGFFLGPGPDGRGQVGPVPRPTYALLAAVALQGGTPSISDADRARAREDLRHWRASVVVLPDGGTGNRWHSHHDALLATLEALFGPGTRIDDVWLWQVT